MPDDQFPTGSEEDPDNTHFSGSEQQSDETGEPPPIGASAPGAWPVNPDEEDVDLPGGQYPDDIFGAEAGDEAQVSMPDDAFAGGLADVEYGDATDPPAPLPPPAEPQDLADISIDPPPAGDPADVQPLAGGDMFSVDELIGDPTEFDEPDAIEQPPAAKRPTPLALPVDEFETDDVAEPVEAVESPEPLAMPESFESPEPLAMPEPSEPAEPLASPEPLAMPESIEPPEPSADFEPPSDPLPLPSDAIAETPASSFDFASIDATATEPVAFEPPAEQPAEQPERPPALEPISMTQPLEQTPDQAPEFADPGESTGMEVINPYAEVSDEAEVIDPAMAAGGDLEILNREIAEGEKVEIVNPYAEVSDEAEVIDPAMSLSASAPVEAEAPPEAFTRSGFEDEPQPLAADHEEDYATPAAYGEMSYAEISAAPLPDTDRTESVAPPGMEEFAAAGLVVAGAKGKSKGRSKTEKNAAVAGGGKKRSFGMSKKGKKGEAPPPGPVAEQPQYATPAPIPQQADAMVQMPGFPPPPVPAADTLGVPAPDPLAAAEVYAPPPAELPEIERMVPVGEQNATAFVPTEALAESPATVEPVSAKQGKSFADTLLGKVEPGQRHKLFGIPVGKPAPLPGELQAAAPALPPAAMTPTPPAAEMVPTPPAAAETGSPKAIKRGRKQKAPKAAKQPKPAKAKEGKSFADTLLGEVEPGQRHKLFGIPVGEPAPLPGEFQPAAQVPLAAAATVPAEISAPPHAYEAAPVSPVQAYEPAPAPQAYEPAPVPAVQAYEPAPATPSQAFEPAPPPEQTFEAMPVMTPPPTPPAVEAPRATAPEAPAIPPVPPAQSPVASLTPQPPPVEEMPATAGAEVIESLEAAAHRLGKSKRGRKQKAPKATKQPKPAKAKEGKSFADTLLGKVEPGERHKLFGIPVGKPAPLPGELQAAAPAAPPAAVPPAAPAEPTPPASQPNAEQVSPAAPAWQPPVEPSAWQPPPISPHAVQPQYVVPPVEQRTAASTTGENHPYSSFGDAATAVLDPPPPVQHVASAVPAPAVFSAEPYGATSAQTVLGSGAVAVAQLQPEPVAAIAMPATASDLAVAAPLEASVFKLARLAARVMAQAVDIVISTGVLLLIGRLANFGPFAESGVMQGSVDVTGVVFAAVVVAVYQGGMLAYGGGQTLGKRIAKIRVVREDGKPVDLGYAMLREGVAKVLLAVITAGVYVVADALWPAFDKQNRALHDIIVKSRVVEQ